MHNSHKKLIIGKDERLTSVFKNTVASAISKIIGFFVSFAMLPLAIGYLTSEEYGIWVTITSLTAFLQLMDFGIGNSLISKISEEVDEEGGGTIKSVILTSLIISVSVSATLLIFTFIVLHNLQYAVVFNLKTTFLAEQFERCFIAFSIISALNMSVNIVQPIRLGLQEGYKNAPFNLLGYFANLIFVFVAIRMRCNLEVLIVSSCCGGFLFNSVNLICFFKKLPGIAAWDSNYRYKYLGSNIKFFILQLIGLITFNMANLIIVHYYDYTKVAEYGLAFRIFSIPGMILNMAFSGLWSAYAAAKINGEWKWIERIHKKALVNSSCISVVLSLILFLNLDWIAGVLSNGAISISTAMAIGMLIWGCLAGVGGSVASLLNGLNELNDQVLISFISCLVGFSLSLIISREYTYAGPIWGTSLAAMAAYPFLIRAANNVIYQKVRFH